MTSQFEIGKMVQLRADVKRGGVIIDLLPAVAGEFRYRVFHSPTDIRDYHHNQLMGADEPMTSGDYLQKRREIERRRQADIVSQRIAAGILEVHHEQ